MGHFEIRPGINWVGAIDWDRRLFDELIPLPEGTTYNAYVVRGSEKTAIIESVDPEKEKFLVKNLTDLDLEKVDYIVSNHAEQDHSGSLPLLLEMYPDAKLVANPKLKGLLISHLMIDEGRFETVEDGSELSLGDRTLKFILTPWVHWPETMTTYLKEEKIIFPCDLFGAHFATPDMQKPECDILYYSAKRYYAEIMMPFRAQIRKHMEIFAEMDIEVICPSHGPIHHDPSFIMDAYNDWISDNVKNEVLIPYVSMHGSTKEMVDILTDSLIKRNVSAKPFNLTVTDIGELAMATVDAATIVLGTPTVITAPHPAAVYATYLVNLLRPKTKFITVIGSYGWGTKAIDTVTGMLGNMKAEILEPVYIKGYPKDQDIDAIERLAEDIVSRHKGLGIL